MQAEQNIPSADSFRLRVDVRGNVSLDKWVVRRPVPERVLVMTISGDPLQ